MRFNFMLLRLSSMGDPTVPMLLMHLAFYIFLPTFCCRGSARSAGTINLCKIIKETAIRLAHTFKTRSDGWMDGATMHPSSFCPRRRRHSLTHSTTTRRIDKLSFPPLFTRPLLSLANIRRREWAMRATSETKRCPLPSGLGSIFPFLWQIGY